MTDQRDTPISLAQRRAWERTMAWLFGPLPSDTAEDAEPPQEPEPIRDTRRDSEAA